MAATEDAATATRAVRNSLSIKSMTSLEAQWDDRPLPNQTDTTSSACNFAEKIRAVRWNGPPWYNLAWEMLGIVVSICFLGKWPKDELYDC
jgi:hypothetical protein